MALTDNERLRQLLGESVPVLGDEADTLFTDAEVSDLIQRFGDEDLDRASYEGWKVKAAKLSNLVDTTEGNQQKKFSQLHDQALDMVKMYLRSSAGPTEGRTRVGRIRRAGVEWS